MRFHFVRRKTLVTKLDDVCQMDVVNMQTHEKDNNGLRYLLKYIEIFSKYAWVLPIKNKLYNAILDGIKNIC